MVWRTWSSTTPADGDAVSAGAEEIRNVRDDIDDRFMTGDGSGGIIDLTGTRTVNTNPLEIRPGIIDTTALEAGAMLSIARAATFFKVTTLPYDASGLTNIGHPGVDAVTANYWRPITGLNVNIPGTVLNSTLGSTEHAGGAAIGTSDYVIFLFFSLVYGQGASTGGNFDVGIFRIYNTTHSQTIGDGDSSGVGAAATHGIRGDARLSSLEPGDLVYERIIGFGMDTLRTTTTTYEIQFAATSFNNGIPGSNAVKPVVNLDRSAARLYTIVFKR